MPQMVRLAFNDAITYNASANTGGANASIRFENSLKRVENIGLQFAMNQVLYLKKDGNHVTKMLSLADLIQLGGYAALEY